MSAESQYEHIVFVSIDTLRADAVAVNPFNLWKVRFPGLPAPRTAILDDLVRRGAFFPNAITAAPYTSAAHGAILTGQVPLRNGLHEFYNGRLRSPSIFSFGKQVGRRTVMKVDFPIILGPELGFVRDVDVYLDEEDDEFIEAVLSSPSSVSLAHFGGVHIPYGFHNLRYGGAAYRAKVDELEALLPDDKPPLVDRLVESHRNAEDTELLMRYKRAVTYLYGTGEYAALMRLYLEGVERFLSTRLAPFLEQLADGMRRLGRRMLLVLFADHGEEFDEYTNGHFNSMSEAVLRVPVFIVGDDIPAAVHRERIRTVDIVPTVLDLAGIELPAGAAFDGRSLAGWIRGGTPEPPATVVAEAYTSDAADFVAFQERQLKGEKPPPLRHVLVGQAAYSGNRKLVRLPRRYQEGFTRIDEIGTSWVERFDADLVPHRYPAADDTDLRALLDAYHQTVPATEPVAATAHIREQLRSLGYTI